MLIKAEKDIRKHIRVIKYIIYYILFKNIDRTRIKIKIRRSRK